MSLPVKQFIASLTQSGLLSTQEIAVFQKQHSINDGRQLAVELVKAKKLTRFQANMVAQGKTERLVFGDYLVVDKIGAGGMGTVFKAWHRRMERFAAIKILSEHVLSAGGAVERFYQEVKTAARLHHPNIVTAYDAGERDGAHYLVMEFVDGKDLSQIVQEQGPLPIEHAFHYVLQTAHGLAYAHEHGIIHRDIKPSNLLLDKQGHVKILDMGLARLIESEAREQTAAERLTAYGQVMGTAEYMAPEQAVSSRNADPRTDVYSLGCTLYRLLTGQSIYQGSTLIETILAHRDKEIPPLRQSRADVTEQMDVVYQRMVAKNPQHRYQSMNEVIAALRPLLSGEEPTQWSSESSSGPMAGLPLASASKVAAGRPPIERTMIEQPSASGASRSSVAGRAANERPTASAGKLPQVEKTVYESRKRNTAKSRPKTRTKRPDKNPAVLGLIIGAVALAVLFAVGAVILITWQWNAGNSDNDPKDVAKATSKSGNQNDKKKLMDGPQATDKPGLVFVYQGHQAGVYPIAISKDGRRLLTGGHEPMVIVWDVRTGKKLNTFKGFTRPLRTIDISPDGRYTAVAGHDPDISLWDLQKGTVADTFSGHGEWVGGVAFSPDGKRLASAGFDKHLRIWDLATRVKMTDIQAHESWIRGVAYSPNGKYVATCGNDWMINIWNASTGQLHKQLAGHREPVQTVSFSHDSKRVVTGGFDESIRIWNVNTGVNEMSFFGHASTVLETLFTYDGMHVVSASDDRTVCLWDVTRGQRVLEFKEHTGPANGVVCTPDGRYAISTSSDQTVRLWRLPLPGLPGVPDLFER